MAVRSLDRRLPKYNDTAVFDLFLNSTLAISTLLLFNFLFFCSCIWTLSRNQPAHNLRERVLQYGKIDKLQNKSDDETLDHFLLAGEDVIRVILDAYVLSI